MSGPPGRKRGSRRPAWHRSELDDRNVPTTAPTRFALSRPGLLDQDRPAGRHRDATSRRLPGHRAGRERDRRQASRKRRDSITPPDRTYGRHIQQSRDPITRDENVDGRHRDRSRTVRHPAPRDVRSRGGDCPPRRGLPVSRVVTPPRRGGASHDEPDSVSVFASPSRSQPSETIAATTHPPASSAGPEVAVR